MECTGTQEITKDIHSFISLGDPEGRVLLGATSVKEGNRAFIYKSRVA